VARILISARRMFKASDCGRLGRQAAGHPCSALRVVKSCRKDYLTALVLLEAKVVALHPEWYQSSLSKLSTKEGGCGGEKKRRQSDWLANQIEKVTDKTGDRQTGRNKADERWHPSRPCSVLNSGLRTIQR
jgi:hypothetical protein